MSKTFSFRAVAAAALLCGSVAAQAATFSFSGITDSGPLSGLSFSGLFSFDDSVVPADGELPLSSFSLSFAGQSYGLAGTTGPTTVAFAGGSFIGMSYLNESGADPAVRPHVAFVPGFFAFDEAYFAYEGAGGLGGFGSYTVSAVPEPWTAALLLAGLGVVMRRARRTHAAR